MRTEIVPVETPEGQGRLYLDSAAEPTSTLVLGHGAGGGVGARDLELLARRLPPLGTTVVRFEQPWRTAGGRVASRPPRLDAAWCAALSQLRTLRGCSAPLVTGGRSAGARVACRTASQVEAAAVLCLAFPLHLPGRPEQTRIAELLAPEVPRLVLQGSRDSFGTAAEVRAAARADPLVSVVELAGADHGFRLAKGSATTAAELNGLLLDATARLIEATRE